MRNDMREIYLKQVLFLLLLMPIYSFAQMNYNIGVTSINKGKLNTITFGFNIDDLQTLIETPKSKLNLGIS
jgi:hypothetical protein